MRDLAVNVSFHQFWLWLVKGEEIHNELSRWRDTRYDLRVARFILVWIQSERSTIKWLSGSYWREKESRVRERRKRMVGRKKTFIKAKVNSWEEGKRVNDSLKEGCGKVKKAREYFNQKRNLSPKVLLDVTSFLAKEQNKAKRWPHFISSWLRNYKVQSH